MLSTALILGPSSCCITTMRGSIKLVKYRCISIEPPGHGLILGLTDDLNSGHAATSGTTSVEDRLRAVYLDFISSAITSR
jgi:hypothetical protein